MRWIHERDHIPLYDLICESLNDASQDVQSYGYLLLRSIDPVALKPHLAIIIEARETIKDRDIKAALGTLAMEIESS